MPFTPKRGIVMLVFVDYPKEVVVNVLMEWLPLSAWVRTGRAIRGSSQEKHFEECLQDDRILLRAGNMPSAESELSNQGTVTWLWKHRVGMQVITFQANQPCHLQCMLDYLLLKGSVVHEINLAKYPLSATDAMTLFQRCPNLTSLDGLCSKSLSSTNLLALRVHCANLQHLAVATGTWSSFKKTAALTQSSFSTLVALRLNVSGRKSDDILGQLARHCPQLRILALPYTYQVTDAGVNALGTHLSQLESLLLTFAVEVTDSGLQRLAQGCPRLQALDLSGCRLLTDAALAALASHCPRLQRVNLSGLPLLTDGAVDALLLGWAALQRLVLANCAVISLGKLAELADRGVSTSAITVREASSQQGGATAVPDAWPGGHWSSYRHQ